MFVSHVSKLVAKSHLQCRANASVRSLSTVPFTSQNIFKKVPVISTSAHIRCLSTESITYSGGQPCTGQGGYYGSGGARAKATPSVDVTQEQRSKMIALASDVEKITIVMDEVDLLQNLLDQEKEEHGEKVTNKSIELRGQIKRLMSNPHFLECLDRLEVEGAPVWGLSSEEHEMIQLAREKINSC